MGCACSVVVSIKGPERGCLGRWQIGCGMLAELCWKEELGVENDLGYLKLGGAWVGSGEHGYGV